MTGTEDDLRFTMRVTGEKVVCGARSRSMVSLGKCTSEGAMRSCSSANVIANCARLTSRLTISRGNLAMYRCVKELQLYKWTATR